MRTSIFAFATDMSDGKLEPVLDDVEHRAGLDGVSLAVSYHHSRDVFPHDPVHKIRFLEGGAVFFRPDPSLYRKTTIRPHTSRLVEEGDPLGELVAAAGRRGLRVRAWAVYLHNTTLASRYPECAVRNAFDDPYLTYLCPAHPDVRAYVVALSRDIARYEVEAILAEALSYQPFEHRYHHERSFVDLGPWARFFLSLCFCPHCLAAAEADGVRAREMRDFVRRELEAIFDDEEAPQPEEEPSRDEVGRCAGGEMAGYLAMREKVVTSLVAEAVEVVGKRIHYMDPGGSIKGFASGMPTGGPAPEISWRSGIDLAAIAQHAGAVEALGYAADPERVRYDVGAYHAALPAGTALELALRPMPPDSRGVEDLRAKVGISREFDVECIDFFHYGLMRKTALDRIRDALRA